MKYSQTAMGRVFVVRLEHGDVLHESIERLAREQSITAAALIVLGGADQGSILVVGPEDGRTAPIHPMELVLENVHEICGVGTVFPDEKGRPVLHMHVASGRNKSTVTGCVRRGVKAWQVMEAVLFELKGFPARRVFDPALGFMLLEPLGE